MSESPRIGSLDPTEDARLVELCLGGDARAWETLVRRHERLVYSVARSYRLAEPEMADVFQDVFAALVKGLPRMRDPRTLCRWLSSTADRIARATALRKRREDALTTADPESLERLPGPAETDADLELLEEQALVRLALGRLPGRCRALLEALYYEEPTPSYADLSRRLGVPIGSLGPTRARCFDRMRAALAALASGDGGISELASPTSPPGTKKSPRSGRAPRTPREAGPGKTMERAE
ncbi:MAG: sigma-70 family RNA polymerase sigma factor [Candidatus Eisenbacteria bacterium]|nr:sigma-70 family RNA polymerase sigma factor [Candidatus Eisenbacteria bacterium]